MRDQSLYVVATTLDETRHAIDVAQTLASGAHVDLTVVVPLPEPSTVSSGRAGVRGLTVEDAEHPDPQLTESAVRALMEPFSLNPRIVVTSGWSARGLTSVLPAGATVVICGRMNRLFETPEQRVARELSKQRFDVVFLPYLDQPRPPDCSFPETEMMRHLMCEIQTRGWP